MSESLVSGGVGGLIFDGGEERVGRGESAESTMTGGHQTCWLLNFGLENGGSTGGTDETESDRK